MIPRNPDRETYPIQILNLSALTYDPIVGRVIWNWQSCSGTYIPFSPFSLETGARIGVSLTEIGRQLGVSTPAISQILGRKKMR